MTGSYWPGGGGSIQGGLRYSAKGREQSEVVFLSDIGLALSECSQERKKLRGIKEDILGNHRRGFRISSVSRSFGLQGRGGT